MRLFTGIALARNVSASLSVLISEFRSVAPFNWTRADNLHITTRFIGEWPEERLPELTTALESVAVTGPIQISVARFGFFPNPHQPHSLFAGVQAGPGLTELAGALEAKLQTLGCKPETRPYRPHVTLARIKRAEADGLRAVRERIAAIENPHFGEFAATKFHLYRSTPGAGSSVYTKLATYDLMRERNTIS